MTLDEYLDLEIGTEMHCVFTYQYAADHGLPVYRKHEKPPVLDPVEGPFVKIVSDNGTFHMHVGNLHVDRMECIERLERMTARHLAVGSSAEDPPTYGGELADFAYCDSVREKLAAQGFRDDETERIRNSA